MCGTDGPPWLSQTVRRDLSEPVEFSLGTGDVIEERVQVVNPKERHYVAVVVPLAAGVEVMNPALATAPPDLLLSRHAPPWLLPGQASAVSALLMGVPWCIAALGPVVAGVLADPARGGTPAGALGWFMLLMPIGLGAAVRVRSRGPSPAR